MNNIIWLASYPKSGNTWFRCFLLNLLSDGERPVDINRLDDIPVAGSRRLFEEATGFDSAELSPGEIEELRPEVYQHLSDQAGQPFFLKIHDALTVNSAGLPLIPPAATRAVLYFIRNPLDVAVSYANHQGIEPAEAVRRLNDESTTLFGEADRGHHQLPQRVLSWSGHVRSWTCAPGLKIMVVRYEDLRLRTEETFTRAVRFLELSATAKTIPRALAFCDFAELQRQEQLAGFREKPPGCRQFFHRGAVGGWRGILPPPLAAVIISTQGDVMRQFGYLDRRNTPVF